MSTKDTLTSRDMELLLVALKSSKTEFAIDYDKFAEGGGFKNKNTAKVIWYGLKKKLDAMKAGDGGFKNKNTAKVIWYGLKKKLDAMKAGDGVGASLAKAGDETSKASSAKGRKRKAAADTGADDDETISKPASKKNRGRKTASPAKEEGGEEIDEASSVKSEPDE